MAFAQIRFSLVSRTVGDCVRILTFFWGVSCTSSDEPDDEAEDRTVFGLSHEPAKNSEPESETVRAKSEFTKDFESENSEPESEAGKAKDRPVFGLSVSLATFVSECLDSCASFVCDSIGKRCEFTKDFEPESGTGRAKSEFTKDFECVVVVVVVVVFFIL